MPKFPIAGYAVDFPFEPYEVQKEYMRKVIESLETSQNAMLESPTGTGKTLSLLCSSLAWLMVKKAEHEASRPKILDDMRTKDLDFATIMSMTDGTPKIIYASRTHTQLSQAMQEMKRSGYAHLRAVVLGSRNQMCIHPEVSKETNSSVQINLCKHTVKKKECSFHSNVENMKCSEELSSGVVDIEDLVTKGRSSKFCPYYMSKELYKEANIIFMPYNYILDPKARRANQIELNNCVVILDEGHNVEKMCEDAMSLQLTSTDVASSITDVTSAMELLDKAQDSGDMLGYEERKDISLDDLATFKEVLLALEKTIDVIKVDHKKTGVTFGGEYVYDFLSQASISFQNFRAMLNLIDNLLQYFAVVSLNKALGVKGVGLQKLADLLSIVFAQNSDEYREKVTKCYRVHVEIEEQNTYAKDGWKSTRPSTILAKAFSFWCFSPAFGMDFLRKVRCVIITSGTLAPMKPLISEMGIEFPVQLENPHIVTREQVCVKVVSQGSDKEPLISNYANRDNVKYITSLGRTLLSFAPVIPGGILIFFPSYTLMTKCQNAWQESGLWSQICNIKSIYVESRKKNDFQDTMTEYYAKIRDPGSRGAIFMAVCRGKVSEGLDFADLNGRAVLIPGLPFPPLYDPRVMLKKQYLEENRRTMKELISGNDWYCLEASRAVNQAIGRVIRHKNDYGAILLCDSRFQNPQQKNQLSKWVLGHLNSPGSNGMNFGPLIGEVSRFFRNAEKKFDDPEKQIKRFDYGEGPSTSSAEVKHNSGLTRLKEVLSTSFPLQKSVIDTYKDLPQSSKSHNSDFLSSLNGEVKSIDFNDVENPYMTSTSDALPQSSQEGVRKRKYKLVDNDSPSLLEYGKPEEEEEQAEPGELPENRVECLKYIKTKLDILDYKKFVICLHNYNTHGNVESFFTTLHALFGTPRNHFILRGLQRFVKSEHKDAFENLLRQHLEE
ncbi:regulator of telomere elongation helicase 1 homolog [Phlebotomus argentipes]|uniref:regulator of telomere elongation helicase 1 homolog n=1 Tax=Phlebotomus argentipes TaxID=94469 RepID=UPI00289325BA|nr:regulator of telomere elongation helicase 1 homolog [Phlebotomus argentipes]